VALSEETTDQPACFLPFLNNAFAVFENEKYESVWWRTKKAFGSFASSELKSVAANRVGCRTSSTFYLERSICFDRASNTYASEKEGSICNGGEAWNRDYCTDRIIRPEGLAVHAIFGLIGSMVL
jgi:hypothetical protein